MPIGKSGLKSSIAELSLIPTSISKSLACKASIIDNSLLKLAIFWSTTALFKSFLLLFKFSIVLAIEVDLSELIKSLLEDNPFFLAMFNYYLG